MATVKLVGLLAMFVHSSLSEVNNVTTTAMMSNTTTTNSTIVAAVNTDCTFSWIGLLIIAGITFGITIAVFLIIWCVICKYIKYIHQYLFYIFFAFSKKINITFQQRNHVILFLHIQKKSWSGDLVKYFSICATFLQFYTNTNLLLHCFIVLEYYFYSTVNK